LVEIMIVVGAIGMIAYIAIGACARELTRSENSTVVTDLKTFAAVFDQYARETGNWPGVAVGSIPREVAGRLNETSWCRKVPGGGRYGFAHNSAGLAAISIHDSALPVERLSAIDTLIDDGDLTTGRFRRHDDCLIYVVQEAR
jgi:hypothetical protein